MEKKSFIFDKPLISSSLPFQKTIQSYSAFSITCTDRSKRGFFHLTNGISPFAIHPLRFELDPNLKVNLNCEFQVHLENIEFQIIDVRSDYLLEYGHHIVLLCKMMSNPNIKTIYEHGELKTNLSQIKNSFLSARIMNNQLKIKNLDFFEKSFDNVFLQQQQHSCILVDYLFFI